MDLRLLLTTFLFAAAAGAASALPVTPSEQDERYLRHGGAERSLAVNDPLRARFEIIFEFQPDAASLRGQNIVCSDPFRPDVTIRPWAFIKFGAEHIARNFLEARLERLALNNTFTGVVPDGTDERLKWQLDAEPYLTEVSDRRRLMTRFRFGTGGTCFYCDPDNVDQRRLGDSEGQSRKLTDLIARGLKVGLQKYCGLSELARVQFNRI